MANVEMSYEELALNHIKCEVDAKIKEGKSPADAVYAVKRELVQMTRPLEATGNYRMAIDYMQKAKKCSLMAALTALKLLVREKYNNPNALLNQ